jgi:hypothetical protein
MTQFRETGCMPNGGAFRGELCVLTRMWVRCAQLLQLPAKVFLLAAATRSKLVEIAECADRRHPRRVACANGRPQVNRARVPVEQLGLRFSVEQRLVLVLTVKRDQATADLAQLAGVGRSPVDTRSATLPQLALKDEGIAPRLEHPLDGRLLRAVPDLVGAPAAPERETQGVHDEGFAAPGFACEQIEPWTEPHARLCDEGQVPDPELSQHHFMGTSGRPHPSFSPSLR